MSALQSSFNTVNAMSGKYNVSQVTSASATEKFTAAIDKNRLTLGGLIKQRQLYNVALKEQLALQNASMVSFGRNARGQTMSSVLVPTNYIPKGFEQRLQAARTSVGMFGQTMKSVSLAGSEWARGLQRTGFQITQGIGLPLAALAAVAGVTFYKVDQALTAITKVYDTQADKYVDGADKQIAKQRELEQVRSASMENARKVAQTYGASISDTLDIEGQLAATGQRGIDLLKATNEVQRISILGDVDKADAIKATITLQGLYNASTSDLASTFNLLNQVENETSLATKDAVAAYPKLLPIIKGFGGETRTMAMNVADANVLLVGLRSAGIDAVEGANGIKSGIGSLLKPTTVTKKALGELGITIDDIAASAGGDVLKAFSILNSRIKGLDAVGQQEVFVRLFGKEQFARMQSLAKAVGDVDQVSGNSIKTNEKLYSSMTQAQKAWFQAYQQNKDVWADTASNEMFQKQNSASQKFKIVVESIKASLADLGKTVLEFATPIAGFIGKVIAKIAELPEGVKKAGVLGIFLTVIAGGAFLVAGAIANLALTLSAAVGGFLALITRFKALSPASLAARQAANTATAAFGTQATALGTLTTRVQAYAAAMREAALVQAGVRTVTPGGTAPAPGMVPPVVPRGGYSGSGVRYAGQTMPASTAPMLGPSSAASLGNSRYFNNGAIYSAGGLQRGRGGAVTGVKYSREVNGTTSRSSEANFRAAEAAAKKAEATAIRANAQATEIANKAQATRASFTGMASSAAGLAMLIPTINTFKDDSASAAQKWTMLGLTVAVLAPGIASIGVAIKGMGVAAMAGGFKAAAASIAGFLGPLGIAVVAVGAIAAAAYLISKHITTSGERIEQAKKNTQTWAEVLGYVQTQTIGSNDDAGKSIAAQAAAIEKLKKDNKELYATLTDVKDAEEAIKNARQQALVVSSTGGDAAAVEKAARIALTLGGVTGKAQDRAININLKPIIENPEAVQDQINDQVNRLMQNAVDKADNTSLWYRILNTGKNKQAVSEESMQAATDAAQTFLNTFEQASTNEQRGSLFKGFLDQWNKNSAGSFETIRKDNKKLFSSLGIDSQTALSEQMRLGAELTNNRSKGLKSSDEAMAGGNAAVEARVKLYTTLAGVTSYSTQTEKQMAQTLAVNSNMSEEAAAKITTLAQLSEKWGGNVGATTRSVGANTVTLGGNTDAVEDNTEALQAQQAELDKTKETMADIAKNTMSGTMDAVYESFARQRESQQEAALDRIEANGQARLDKLDAQDETKQAEFDARQEASDASFDKRQKNLRDTQKAEDKQFSSNWEAIMDAHNKKYEDEKKAVESASDARIAGIDAAIDAEEKAEEIRQRIFAAEQARVQRLSEMFNRNIDFNAALNSGNLDEAAKIQNDASATSMQWAADDTAATAGSGSDARKEALNGQKDAEQIARQAALDAIDDAEEREQKQLEDRKDREAELLQARQDAMSEQLDNEQKMWDKSLDQEKKSYSKSVEAQRVSINAQVDAQTKSAKAKQDVENRSLEAQLAALKAMTPRNEAELNDHIGRLQGLYNQFGTSYIKPTATSWGQEFGNQQKWAFEAAAASARDNIKWSEVGQSITNQMASAFDISGDQLLQWLKTGVYPSSTGGAGGGRNYSLGSSAGSTSTGKGRVNAGMFHTGGGPGWSSADRVGIPRSASLYPSETPAILKRGEFVVNERASRQNAGLLHAINSGNAISRHSGGFGSGAGAGGLMAAAVGAALGKSIASMIQNTVASASGAYGTAGAGKYGNTNLSSDQLSNASIIMNVGKSMGASQRDLVIAIMTAMQESQLKNISYGDRDSVGLFQQRTSQGWGSVEQIMNPEYSSRKFFEALLKVKNRDSMALTEAAQKVQRSGFPQAYAKWESMAQAVVSGTPTFMSPDGGMAGGANGVAASMTGVDKNGYTYPAMMSIMAGSGVPYQVTSTKRNKNDNSLHNKGYAVDFDDFSSPKVDTPGLFAIWQWLYKNFGSKSSELIYAGPGATSIKNGRAHQYNAATMAGHHNHVHWGMTPDALASLRNVPQLSVGGNIKYDNVLANLHKGETVLTAPLSSQLERGINSMNSNTSAVEFNINGTVIREDADIDRLANAIMSKIENRDRRNGGTRVVKR